jgi:hypothetical protein
MKNKRERNSQTEMAVAQESRLGILEPMQTAESSSSEFKLNDWETQVLKDKLPRQRILLRSILFGLDIAFGFNRTKLAEFLKTQHLIGYSRPNLYKILGPPMLSSQEYEKMNELLTRMGAPHLLRLLLQRKAYRAISEGSLGSKRGNRVSSDKTPSTGTHYHWGEMKERNKTERQDSKKRDHLKGIPKLEIEKSGLTFEEFSKELSKLSAQDPEKDLQYVLCSDGKHHRISISQ